MSAARGSHARGWARRASTRGDRAGAPAQLEHALGLAHITAHQRLFFLVYGVPQALFDPR